MSPMQKFVITSEQSLLAKRHRRNVFRARIISACSVKNVVAVFIHAGLIVFFVVITTALYAFMSTVMGGGI